MVWLHAPLGNKTYISCNVRTLKMSYAFCYSQVTFEIIGNSFNYKFSCACGSLGNNTICCENRPIFRMGALVSTQPSMSGQGEPDPTPARGPSKDNGSGNLGILPVVRRTEFIPFYNAAVAPCP